MLGGERIELNTVSSLKFSSFEDPTWTSMSLGLSSRLRCSWRRFAWVRACASSAPLTTALPRGRLPADVDPESGLCADGFVRIAESARKGLGAFAVLPMSPALEVGRYAGEVMTLGEMFERYYGTGEESPDFVEAVTKQAAWIAERQARGVGVTGTYLFNAGKCPKTFRTLVLDAEDPVHANWTRFINHSARQPNLTVWAGVVAGSEGGPSIPAIRFTALRPIAPGDELLFDYGDGSDLDVMSFVD